MTSIQTQHQLVMSRDLNGNSKCARQCTLVEESTKAPRSMSSVTMFTCPSFDARCNAFKPFYAHATHYTVHWMLIPVQKYPVLMMAHPPPPNCTWRPLPAGDRKRLYENKGEWRKGRLGKGTEDIGKWSPKSGLGLPSLKCGIVGWLCLSNCTKVVKLVIIKNK